jgi:hypothetical protein
MKFVCIQLGNIEISHDDGHEATVSRLASNHFNVKHLQKLP